MPKKLEIYKGSYNLEQPSLLESCRGGAIHLAGSRQDSQIPSSVHPVLGSPWPARSDCRLPPFLIYLCACLLCWAGGSLRAEPVSSPSLHVQGLDQADMKKQFSGCLWHGIDCFAH